MDTESSYIQNTPANPFGGAGADLNKSKPNGIEKAYQQTMSTPNKSAAINQQTNNANSTVTSGL